MLSSPGPAQAVMLMKAKASLKESRTCDEKDNKDKKGGWFTAALEVTENWAV
jgi:hypothetical protein